MTGLRCAFVHAGELRAERPQRRPKKLERREVRGKKNDAFPFRERGFEMLGSFDVDALQHGVEPAEPTHRHLDERQAQRLEVLHEYPRALLGRQVAQAGVDVARGDAAAVPQQRVRQAPQRPPEGHLRAEGQQDHEPHPGVPEPGDGIPQRRELRGPEVI